MDYANLTAPCGLDCFNCPMYAAQENEKLRAMIAQRFDISPDKAQCPGCRAQGGIIDFFDWTEPCKVWRCIEPKGLHNCSECGDFPCDHLHPYADLAAERPHNTKVFNLALIKKMGLEPWAKEKAAQVKETYYQGKLEL